MAFIITELVYIFVKGPAEGRLRVREFALKTCWWTSAVVCSMVRFLSLWHIPNFHSQFYLVNSSTGLKWYPFIYTSFDFNNLTFNTTLNFTKNLEYSIQWLFDVRFIWQNLSEFFISFCTFKQKNMFKLETSFRSWSDF